MINIEQTVSNLIPGQFPSFYNEQGPNFIEFMQAYYQWMEQSYPTLKLTVRNISSVNGFSNGEVVYQTVTGVNTAVGTVINVSGPTLTVNGFSGSFNSNLVLTGAASNVTANVATVSNTFTAGNPIHQARNLPAYADVDNTLEEFLVYFTNTYLQGIQYESLIDRRLAIKKILDLYRAKGNIRGLKLLFQLVFGEDISIYLPAQDILKTSDGTWTVPSYLEITNSPRNKEFVGKTINGVSSGATAFVDRIVTRKVGSKYVYMFIITNQSDKDFQTGELLNVDNNLDGVPNVIGSLSSLVVSSGGYGFAVGDIVNLSSYYGIEGTGRVTSISDVTGIVQFQLLDGGWGYSNTSMSTVGSNIVISNTVLYLSSINSTLPTNQRPFEKFANLLVYSTTNAAAANLYVNSFGWGTTANVYALANSGSFVVGESVTSSDGNANGIVTSVTTNVYTQLTLSSPSGSFRINETVYQANSTANLAVGRVIYSNSTAAIVSTGNGAFITTTLTNNYKAVGVTSGAQSNITISVSPLISTIGVKGVVESYFAPNVTMTGTTSTATANVLYFNSELGITGLNNSLTTDYNAVTAIYPGYVTYSANNGFFFGGELVYQANASANIATGTVISSNSTVINIVPISGQFVPTTGANTGLQLAISNTVIGTNTGAFTPGEIIYQSNGSANTATGYLVGANSSVLVINPTSGLFVPSAPSTFGLTGGASNATSTITGPNNTVQFTGNLLNGSQVINAISSNAGLVIGQRVTSATAGIDANSTITAINATAVTMSIGFTGTTTTGATINATSIAISNASYSNAVITTYTPINQANALLTGFSTGNFANISIGIVNTTETLFNYTDLVGANNSYGQPYLLLPLTASTYGFPKYPSANLTAGYLRDILAFNLLQVGEIENIIVTNPGQKYSHAPYVDIYSPAVAGKNKQDYVISITGLSGTYTVGEELLQNVALTDGTIALNLGANVGGFTAGQTLIQYKSNTAGTYLANTLSSNLVSNTGTPSFTSTFAVGNQLLIGNSDIRLVTAVAAGAITLSSPPSTGNGVANVSIIALGSITGTPQANLLNVITVSTANFAINSNVFAFGAASYNANVTGTAATPYGTAIGKVLASNTSVVSVRRWSLNQDFSNSAGSGLLTGVLSGTTATVNLVQANTISAYAGDNANISSNVVTASGTASTLAVQTSGIGYINSESVTFTSQDETRSGTAITILGKQGVGPGYYSTTKGFLDSDKYIQDGNYYQTFSYQINSSLPTSSYEKMVNDVAHMAGTKMYGGVIKKSTLSAPVSISNQSLGPNTSPIVG